MEQDAANLDIREILAALAEPETFPHPVRNLHVVQTHTSCVALTGELAYKVKKPVDFGFLDYSTPGKRRALCEEEVRLNRRLCPEVYLDVLPVVRTGLGLRIGLAGEVVDWAVRMRQIPEADSLPTRLQSGAVSAEQIARIAGILAEFHAASPAHEVDRFGSSTQIAANFEDNLRQLEAYTGDELTPAHLAAMRSFSEKFLTAQSGLLEQRIRAGRIRDGHGDLRAQNICLFPGLQDGVQILDCIEFNDRFRFGDVASDLAYLAMDLDLSGRRDLREVLISAYEGTAGDPGLRQVLPFYLCYRAGVRGKIAMFAAAESEIPASERRQHRELAAAAFDLAFSYARGQRRPTLWVTCGLSGSGKSALARELARRAPAVLLSSDRVRKELAGVQPQGRLPDQSYQAEAVSQVYAEMRRRAGPPLRQRIDIILDATFLSRAERDAARSLAVETGADFRVVECVCPDAEIRRRLQERGPSEHASDATIQVYEGQLRRQEPLGEDEERIAIRTDQPLATAAREAILR